MIKIKAKAMPKKSNKVPIALLKETTCAFEMTNKWIQKQTNKNKGIVRISNQLVFK